MGKKIIVVGASSGIGKAIAVAELKQGNQVVCIARREAELKGITDTFSEAKYLVCDVTSEKSIQLTWKTALQLLGGIDILYYASGLLLPASGDDFDFGKDKAMMEVNLLGAMSFCNLASATMARQGSGSIVGISSIAGDRGRKGNPAYNASKAGLNCYLESLRNRLASRKVHVCTVKPGFVRTPMLEGVPVPKKGLLQPISAERAGEEIVQAVRKGKDEVYVPGIWRLVGLILVHVPRFIFKKLDL